jgi:hypothetical protein
LNPKCDEQLPNFPLNFNSRRFNLVGWGWRSLVLQRKVGAYTRPLSGST